MKNLLYTALGFAAGYALFNKSISIGDAMKHTEVKYTYSPETETFYAQTSIQAGKKHYNFIQANGKYNYVAVADINSPWTHGGKITTDYKNWDALQAHYKNPKMKAMVLYAETILSEYTIEKLSA